MNMVKLVMLVITNNVEELAAWGRERITHALRLLYLSILLPLALLIIGVIVGWIGYNNDIPGLVGAADIFLIVSAFLAALLLALFWMKTAVLTHLVVAASQVGSIAVSGISLDKVEIPALSRESAELFIRWMRGVTGWLTFVCLWGAVFPLWQHVGLALIAATCFLFLSAAMSARWVDGARMRKAVIWMVVILLCAVSFGIVAPRAAQNVRSGINGMLDQASFWNDNRQKMATVERKAVASQKKLDLDLVRNLRSRQEELKKRAVYRCGGNFCTPGDRAEHATLDRRVEAIQDGSHWNTVVKADAPKAVTPSSQSRQPDRTQKRVRSRKTKAEIDYIFEGLDQFTDVD